MRDRERERERDGENGQKGICFSRFVHQVEKLARRSKIDWHVAAK